MKTVFDTDLHFHGGNCSFFDGVIGQEDGKVEFFSKSSFHVSGQSASEEVSDSPSDTVECLILFFEVRELELESFAFSENTSWLEFF